MTDLSGLLLPLLLLLLVGFMFLSQRRRQRAAVELQSALRVGSEVCTTSGLYGVITALDDTIAHLEVAPGTVVRFDRRAVALAVTPGTQVPGASSDGEDASPSGPAAGSPSLRKPASDPSDATPLSAPNPLTDEK